MAKTSSWIIFIPVLLFGLASWFFVADRSDVRIAYERSMEQWRSGQSQAALAGFLRLAEEHPDSEMASESLWQAATICYYRLYDLSDAIHHFERLIEEYPESARVVDSHLILASIFEVELKEDENAIRHWKEALKLAPLSQGREICFKIADAHFRGGRLEEAREMFSTLIPSSGESDHVGRRAGIRLGTILQLGKEYEQSVEMFQSVLEGRPCSDCRFQAQLGLIESYEVMDRLSSAIQIARNLDSSHYPPEMQQDLLDRLLEKRQYYEPKLWTGR